MGLKPGNNYCNHYSCCFQDDFSRKIPRIVVMASSFAVKSLPSNLKQPVFLVLRLFRQCTELKYLFKKLCYYPMNSLFSFTYFDSPEAKNIYIKACGTYPSIL